MPDAGAPLVLLPGMNCSARLWVGLGGTDEAIVPVLSEPTLTGQVDRLLDELPVTFRLVGLSLGAMVAMALMRTAPARVERLGLMATSPYAPNDQQRAAWLGHRRQLAAGVSPREIQLGLLPQLLSASARKRPDVVEATLAMGDDVGEERFDHQLAMQATRIDERPTLTAVRCPTTVLAARQDAMCPVAWHADIAALVPGARLEVVDEAGHLAPLERPAAVARALRSAGLL